jgi:hypothetical protein
MKPVLELLAASALSLGLVIGGVVVASAMLSHEKEQPHEFTGLDIRDLWTSKPVQIDRSAQNLERLPPRYANTVVMTGAAEPVRQTASDTAIEDPSARASQTVLGSTASISDEGSSFVSEALAPLQLGWCSERYRSYDPSDNSYQPFGGGPRRQCQLASF